MTADGKDLAEVFLGKQEKAASAATADMADVASSVEWEDIQNPPTIWASFNYAGVVNVSTLSWTAPSAGFICAAQGDYPDRPLHIIVDGVRLDRNILIDHTDGGLSAWFPINKGSVVGIASEQIRIKALFIPLA